MAKNKTFSESFFLVALLIYNPEAINAFESCKIQGNLQPRYIVVEYLVIVFEVANKRVLAIFFNSSNWFNSVTEGKQTWMLILSFLIYDQCRWHSSYFSTIILTHKTFILKIHLHMLLKTFFYFSFYFSSFCIACTERINKIVRTPYDTNLVKVCLLLYAMLLRDISSMDLKATNTMTNLLISFDQHFFHLLHLCNWFGDINYLCWSSFEFLFCF